MTSTTVRNGIDVDQLLGTIEATKADHVMANSVPVATSLEVV